MPAANQRFVMEPSRQFRDPAGRPLGDRDHRLDGIGRRERRRAEGSPTPRRRTVNMSSSPSRRDARRRASVSRAGGRGPWRGAAPQRHRGGRTPAPSRWSTQRPGPWAGGPRRCDACAMCSAARAACRRRPCATPAASALAPSMTTSRPTDAMSGPRATRSASKRRDHGLVLGVAQPQPDGRPWCRRR